MTPPQTKTGLCLGYDQSSHPFCSVNITDRASVQDLLKTLLDPLQPFFSPQKARVKLPGGTGIRFDHVASELEGFARPLWGLSALLAGGGSYEGTELWIEGFKAGVDPESPEYWGDIKDSDQRMVECCVLGFTLAVVPDFWQSMSVRDKNNTEAWLLSFINKRYRPLPYMKVRNRCVRSNYETACQTQTGYGSAPWQIL